MLRTFLLPAVCRAHVRWLGLATCRLPHSGQSGVLPERCGVRASPAPAQCRSPDLTASTLGGSRSAGASGAGA
eukprot:5595322-Alexandrium_andersonii.AAC.1